MMSDLNESLGSRYFPNVTNETTCFASCARAFNLQSLSLTLSHFVPSVTFVVLTADQLVGRNDGPPKQHKQDSHLRRRKLTFPLIFKARILTTKRRKSKRIRIKNEKTLRICWLVVHTGAEVVAFDRNFDIHKVSDILQVNVRSDETN